MLSPNGVEPRSLTIQKLIAKLLTSSKTGTKAVSEFAVALHRPVCSATENWTLEMCRFNGVQMAWHSYACNTTFASRFKYFLNSLNSRSQDFGSDISNREVE